MLEAPGLAGGGALIAPPHDSSIEQVEALDALPVDRVKRQNAQGRAPSCLEQEFEPFAAVDVRVPYPAAIADL